MKIIKRNNSKPIPTIQIWLIPMLTYGISKLIGMQFNNNEYIWWVLIPFMVFIWIIINWKYKN